MTTTTDHPGGSLAPQAQTCARQFATTREDYLRAHENEALNELETALAGATLAEKVAHIERVAERLGAMG